MNIRFAAALVLVAAAAALAQTNADHSAPQSPFLFNIGFDGSADSSGQVMDLGTMIGYKFGRHFQADVAIPFYFLSSASSGTATGPGNAALALRLLFGSPLNYSSSLTGFAPTGSTDLGLSTGRLTFDWSNHIDHDFGRVTPEADLGFANTVVDSRHFVRPYTTLGLNSHAAGGATFDLFKDVSLEATAYAVLPFGPQKMYSRQVRGAAIGNPTPPHGRAFESNHFTAGTADLTRDNGFTAGLDLTPAPCLDMYGGYTHSVKFALDEVSFGIDLNLGQLIHPDGCKKR